MLEKHEGLRGKFVAICTDNAEVMKVTANLLKFPWFGCFPHNLNLLVKDGFKDAHLQELLNNVRAIASQCHTSIEARRPVMH